MSTRRGRQRQRDHREAVLFDLMCAAADTYGANEPPSPVFVEAWCARFPEHAAAIRADVAAWVRRDLAQNRIPLHYRWARRADPLRAS